MKKKVFLIVIGFQVFMLLASFGIESTTFAGAEETTDFIDLKLVFVVFNPPFSSVNQNVTMVAQIFNNGTLDVSNVKVNFYVNNSLIGCRETSVLAGGLNETGVFWASALPGVYNVIVVVDPLDEQCAFRVLPCGG